MPALKKIGFTETFSKLNMVSQAKNETNDCTVKALAIVANVTYDEAHRALANAGRKARQGCYQGAQYAALKTLGKKLERVDMRPILATFPKDRKGNIRRNMTTHHPRRFNKVWPKGTYLLYTIGHVSAVVDGVMHDWAANTSRRVISMYRVVNA
jgi:hypothetical protein